MNAVVYWITKDNEKRKEICISLGLSTGININREAAYQVDEGTMNKLRELERDGLIDIRKK